MKIGYIHEEDGRRWLRIEEAGTGDVWDEPAEDYEDIVPTEPGGERYFLNKRTGERVYPD